jgi:hypothetical protein
MEETVCIKCGCSPCICEREWTPNLNDLSDTCPVHGNWLAKGGRSAFHEDGSCDVENTDFMVCRPARCIRNDKVVRKEFECGIAALTAEYNEATGKWQYFSEVG